MVKKFQLLASSAFVSLVIATSAMAAGPVYSGQSITSNDGGTTITGATMPSGGAGLTGWMSAIWSKLSGTLTTSLTGSLPAGSNGIGSVTVSNLPGTQAVSAATLPLPSGAATAANQPAITAPGTSATVSAEPIQGVSGGVAVPISGTVTSNDGGTKITAATMPSGGVGDTGWQSGIYLTLSNETGVIGAATAPTNMLVAGGIYNSTLPSPTNGQSMALQVDSRGRIWVDEFNASNTFGTTTGAVAPTGFQESGGIYNSSLPSLTNGYGVSLQTDVNGRLLSVDKNVNLSSGVIGAATAPTNMLMSGGVYSGGETLTNGQSSALQLNNLGQMLTYDANSALLTGTRNSMAAASAVSFGFGVLGEYLSSPPTLTSGQSEALQLTASGALMSQEAWAGKESVSINPSTANINAKVIAGVYQSAGVTQTTGQSAALQMRSNGDLLVTSGSQAAGVYLTPAVTASSYSAGYDMGGLLSFTSATRTNSLNGIVQEVRAGFASGIQPSLDLVIFNANPTNSTITDHAALAIASADMGKVVGVVHITDCTLLGTPALCQATQQARQFTLAAGTTLYGALVQRTSAGVTPGSTSDLTVSIGVVQE